MNQEIWGSIACYISGFIDDDRSRLRGIMNKTSIKLILSFVGFLASNLWLIAKGVTKGSAGFFISPVVEETIIFIFLQLFVIIVYLIRPLTVKKSQLIYWCVSEAMVVATVWFWGFFIVGPIWLKWHRFRFARINE